MRRHLLPLAMLWLAASGCNCGKPIVTMTQSSLTIPVDVLDFGVVAEGTSKGSKFRVENVGRAPVNITVMLEGSSDFAIGTVPVSVEAGGFIEVPVTFTPVGLGSDEGMASIASPGEEMPLVVILKGGPIEPRLDFVPNPLAFGPGNLPLERKTANIKSVGTSALTVRSVGVVATGNPNFSIVPPQLPARLLPGETLGVTVEYTRTALTTTGFMEVLSDDVDAGRRLLELFPDPPTVCSDRVDNDNDGLIDFPADPGCQDAADNDESNAAQCVNGASQPCDIGTCQFAGNRTCANNLWGMCMGSCDGGVADAGVDAGVRDAGTDAGTSCGALGTYALNLDGGFPVYSCCEFLGTPLVNVEVDSFTIQTGGTVTRPGPTQPGSTLTANMGNGTAAVCPGGSFVHARVLPGGCTETYRLTATFVDANTFVGTYSASFSGADCNGGGSGLCGTPCIDQSWNISATK